MTVRRNTKQPLNDKLILQLLETGTLVVQETEPETLFDEHGNHARPTCRVLAKSLKTGRYFIPRVDYDGFGEAPRIRITIIDPANSSSPRIRLSVRRIVWLAHNPRATSEMVCPIDGNPRNYNYWNLCLRDQNDQNWIRMQREANPEEDEVEGDSNWIDDIPF